MFSTCTVDEVEAFEPVLRKPKLVTDTDSDEKKAHLDIGRFCARGCFYISCKV